MNRKIILSNAFSIQMLHGDARVSFKEVDPYEVSLDLKNGNFVSAIGHEDTANVLSDMFSIQIYKNRINVLLDDNTTL